MLTKLGRRKRIKSRIRKIISGTTERPRLSVFRSNKHIYAQLVDDLTGSTMAFSSTVSISSDTNNLNKTDQAKKVGEDIAKKAGDKGIKSAVFDRGGYLYHGRIKALAGAARENGLKF